MVVSSTTVAAALEEVSARKAREATYTEPLWDKSKVYTTEELEENKAYKAQYYRTIFKRREECAALCRDNADTIGHYFKALVPLRVTRDDFWQRYFYRCDPDRILKEWDRRDAAALSASVVPSEQTHNTKQKSFPQQQPKQRIPKKTKNISTEEVKPVTSFSFSRLFSKNRLNASSSKTSKRSRPDEKSLTSSDTGTDASNQAAMKRKSSRLPVHQPPEKEVKNIATKVAYSLPLVSTETCVAKSNSDTLLESVGNTGMCSISATKTPNDRPIAIQSHAPTHDNVTPSHEDKMHELQSDLPVNRATSTTFPRTDRLQSEKLSLDNTFSSKHAIDDGEFITKGVKDIDDNNFLSENQDTSSQQMIVIPLDVDQTRNSDCTDKKDITNDVTSNLTHALIKPDEESVLNSGKWNDSPRAPDIVIHYSGNHDLCDLRNCIEQESGGNSVMQVEKDTGAFVCDLITHSSPTCTTEEVNVNTFSPFQDANKSTLIPLESLPQHPRNRRREIERWFHKKRGNASAETSVDMSLAKSEDLPMFQAAETSHYNRKCIEEHLDFSGNYEKKLESSYQSLVKTQTEPFKNVKDHLADFHLSAAARLDVSEMLQAVTYDRPKTSLHEQSSKLKETVHEVSPAGVKSGIKVLEEKSSYKSNADPWDTSPSLHLSPDVQPLIELKRDVERTTISPLIPSVLFLDQGQFQEHDSNSKEISMPMVEGIKEKPFLNQESVTCASLNADLIAFLHPRNYKENVSKSTTMEPPCPGDHGFQSNLGMTEPLENIFDREDSNQSQLLCVKNVLGRKWDDCRNSLSQGESNEACKATMINDDHKFQNGNAGRKAISKALNQLSSINDATPTRLIHVWLNDAKQLVENQETADAGSISAIIGSALKQRLQQRCEELACIDDNDSSTCSSIEKTPQVQATVISTIIELDQHSNGETFHERELPIKKFDESSGLGAIKLEEDNGFLSGHSIHRTCSSIGSPEFCMTNALNSTLLMISLLKRCVDFTNYQALRRAFTSTFYIDLFNKANAKFSNESSHGSLQNDRVNGSRAMHHIGENWQYGNIPIMIVVNTSKGLELHPITTNPQDNEFSSVSSAFRLNPRLCFVDALFILGLGILVMYFIPLIDKEYLCAPAMGRLVTGRSEAPFWVPPAYKASVFQTVCGTSTQRVSLDWIPTGNKLFRFCMKSNGMQIMKRTRLSNATVTPSQIVLIDAMGREEAVIAPWVRNEDVYLRGKRNQLEFNVRQNRGQWEKLVDQLTGFGRILDSLLKLENPSIEC
jgi:hypothetical protein